MGDFVASASARPPKLSERLLPTWAEIRPEDIYAGLALPEGPTDRPTGESTKRDVTGIDT